MPVLVVTNNPKVIKKAQQLSYEVIETKTLPEVLVKARDLVHKNYKLVNHPLVTSIKPYENLFKTVVLEEGVKMDFYSLEIMENSIAKAEQFKKPARLNQQAKEDYQTIDLGVFLEAIR